MNTHTHTHTHSAGAASDRSEHGDAADAARGNVRDDDPGRRRRVRA